MSSPTVAERDLEGGSSKKARSADRRQIWRYTCLGSATVASDILGEGSTRKESVPPVRGAPAAATEYTTRPAGPPPDPDYTDD